MSEIGDRKARCLIPAAGLGTRLAPVTSVVPKGLLPVGSRPMLQWCIAEALEGGFRELGVVVGEGKTALESYVREGLWREGLPSELRAAAEDVVVVIFRQDRPRGVVDAILTATAWIGDGDPFAVYLPDNVRLAGAPALTSRHLVHAAVHDPLVACHRIGPEEARFFGNVGRVELEDLVPAGAWPRVDALEPRGPGEFRAPPEGAWRLLPRYTVTSAWLAAAREMAGADLAAGAEADDVNVHRSLVQTRRLVAVPWSGIMVDAGRPEGYLYAQHLLHEMDSRRRDSAATTRADDSGLLNIDVSPTS